MKNKKGFTLVELISVIVILSVLAMVVFPMILSSVNNSKNGIKNDNETLAISGAKKYLADNINDFKSYEGNTYCIKLKTLYDGGYINTVSGLDVNDDVTYITDKVEVKYHNNKFEYKYVKSSECVLAGSGQEY